MKPIEHCVDREQIISFFLFLINTILLNTIDNRLIYFTILIICKGGGRIRFSPSRSIGAKE